MEDYSHCPRGLSQGEQAYSDNFWISENVNMQGIFDISNELGFGEEENLMPETNIHCKPECSAEHSETRQLIYEGSTESKHASDDFFSIESGQNDMVANNATETVSPDTEGLSQEQSSLTHPIQIEISRETSEALSVERKSLIGNSHESEESSDLMGMLCKQFHNLQANEMSVEGTNKDGNIGDAVKFDMIMQQLWSQTKTNWDDLRLEVFHHLKTEKMQSQLERIDLHQNDVQEPIHNIKVCNTEKIATGEVHETSDGIVCNALQQFSDQEGTLLEVGNHDERILVVSEDRNALPNTPTKGKSSVVENICVGTYRQSNNSQAFESLLQEKNDLKVWKNPENKLVDTKDMRLSTEYAITQSHMGRERENKEHKLIGHKLLELWKAEVSEHKKTHNRLRYFDAFFGQFQRESTKLISMLQAGSTENIRFTFMNFFKTLVHLHEQGPQIMESSKMEETNEATWVQKERHFVAEVLSVQEKVDWLHEHFEKIEANHFQERNHWKHEIEMCRNECENKLNMLQSMLREREQKLRKESDMWTRLLEVKDENLFNMNFVTKKVVHTLATARNHLSNLQMHLLSQRKQLGKDQELGLLNKGSSTCSSGSPSESGISVMEESGLEMQMFLEKLATHIERDICKVGEELKEDHDRLKKQRNEARFLAVQANKEKLKIEEKLSKASSSVECFNDELKYNEAHLVWERQQLQTLLKIKSEEIEKLKRQLYSKERDIQIMEHNVQDEITMIHRELEKERKERQNDRNQYISFHQNMIKEMIAKEQIWEKQMKGLTNNLSKAKEENINKDHEIEMLREEINDVIKHFEHERRGSGAPGKGPPAWM